MRSPATSDMAALLRVRSATPTATIGRAPVRTRVGRAFFGRDPSPVIQSARALAVDRLRHSVSCSVCAMRRGYAALGRFSAIPGGTRKDQIHSDGRSERARSVECKASRGLSNAGVGSPPMCRTAGRKSLQFRFPGDLDAPTIKVPPMATMKRNLRGARVATGTVFARQGQALDASARSAIPAQAGW